MDLWIDFHTHCLVYLKRHQRVCPLLTQFDQPGHEMAHTDDDAALRRLLCVDGQVQLQEPVISTGGNARKIGSVVLTSYGLLQLRDFQILKLVPADAGTKI